MPTPTHERTTTAAKYSAFISYFSTMLSEEALETTNLWTASIFLFLMTAVARAVFSVRDYIYAKNKNLSGLSRVLFNFTVGGAAAALMGVFIIAPIKGWGVLYYAIMGINGLFAVEAVLNTLGCFYHLALAYQAPASSTERKEALQSAIASINKAFIAATVLTVLLVPFNPPVAFALSVGFVAYLGANVIWHVLPQVRQFVKSLLHLAKPEEDMALSPINKPTQAIKQDRTAEDKTRETKYHASLFGGRAYRKKVVYDYLNKGYVQKAKAYLKDECQTKLDKYAALTSTSNRQLAKQTVLTQALTLLESPDATLEQLLDLIEQNKKVHQSFFAETADTIDLLEGVKLYLREYKSFGSDDLQSEHELTERLGKVA